MRTTKKSTHDKTTINIILTVPIKNSLIKKIITLIKNNNKNKPFLSIFLQVKNKFFTVLPNTKIAYSSINLKNIKDNIVYKTSLFENLYAFETNIITLHINLSKTSLHAKTQT